MRAVREHRTQEQTAIAGIKRALPALLAFAIFGLAVAGIIALRVAIWLPAFHR